ncbi:MAG: hypothetical protein ACI4RD_00275 [Kiritimatiellia bacterium]
MTPVAGAEPPKANPLPGLTPTAHKAPAPGLGSEIRKPTPGGAPAALRPGLKLPPKPGATAAALRPGLKLPPKPGATAAALRPGLKLPTQGALRPGLKLPAKPVIHKPGTAVAAAPLPKPVTPAPAAAPAAPAPVPPSAGPAAAPASVPPPVTPPPAVKPVSVDAQGVGKLPTVSAASIARGVAGPDLSSIPKPMEALKSVTQKMKGLTQEIPQQAILHKTGIIAEGAISAAQKEAAKHKTARISLSDAMGVAPVKEEAAPMKTIRIKRPVAIPPSAPSAPATPAGEGASAAAPTEATKAEAAPSAPTITQRKTLKIARPSGTAVRPGGKFGIKRPGAAAPTAKREPAADAAPAANAPAEGEVSDIPDIPDLPPPAPVAAAAVETEGPAWLWSLSSLVQLAACVALGALAWLLYQNTQTAYF